MLTYAIKYRHVCVNAKVYNLVTKEVWSVEMNIDIEFFDVEPIENLVTCLNFKMDKVIYFGYSDDMTIDKQKLTAKSLKNICGVDNVEFVEICRNNLDKIVESVEKVIQNEYKAGNQCFFELTGGEELELVAMGILSAKYELPMHRFNMKTGEVQTLNENGGKRIDTLVEKRRIELSLDTIVEMHGGAIDYKEEAFSRKQLESKEFEKDTEIMWYIAKKDNKKWNCISAVFKGCTRYEETATRVAIWDKKLHSLANNTQGVGSYEVFKEYLDMLADAEVIKNIRKESGKLIFEYKNELIKECIIEAGTLLELRTFYTMKNTGKYSDCKSGVNINWDGEVGDADDGVENEIDVMLLEGYIPTFVSCKNGKVTQMALYELETVANRFGGKYAKKILVASLGLTEGYAKRAAEMGIEVEDDI